MQNTIMKHEKKILKQDRKEKHLSFLGYQGGMQPEVVQIKNLIREA